ncbi:MAG: fimbrillin family protein [Bacteroidaceae bacterium]|nr:fimbrillin family protein [Bacteroidaceae bacterium]
MKKYYLLILALATMMVACSKDSESIDNSIPASKDNTTVATQQPVTFDAYVNRATTRAGDAGVLKLEPAAAAVDGEVYLRQTGFGVVAYYTDDDQYSPIYKPNFMYNTKVSGDNWTYSPVRYWPNEFGADAASEGVDRLSFFAYAPHVAVNPTTGDVTGDNTSGIVGLSRNGATGDPFVKYYASLDPSKQVDFCWGVNTTTGKPNINMTKQRINEKVEFQFNHALAALNVQVVSMIDQLTPGGSLDADTKIYVRSVTFEGFVTKGAFNLNTDKATWYDLAGVEYIDGGSVTIYDGRTNGREAQSESPNEAPVGLNPVLVQSQPYSGTPTAGVTTTPVNLFGSTTPSAPLYVIPSSQPLTVTIVYDVETKNEKLSTYLSDRETHGTSVENKITKTITFGTGATASNKLEAGKQYNLTLHLGMTTVKFEAEVTDWGDTAVEGSANLPDNMGTTPASGPDPAAPAGTSGYAFSVSDTKQVFIANSNLMWEGTTATGNYSLMEHPWTTIETTGNIGSMPANYGISDTNSVQVSLFGWGTPETPYLTSDDEDDYAVSGFVDWGTYYGDHNWRCLTKTEWVYLLTRNVSAFGKGFAFATVNNVHGMIIIPDNFTTPSGITFVAGLANEYDTNVYTVAQWTILQNVGVVFLPAAGYRDADSERVQSVGEIIDYWCKPVSDSDVAALYYDDSYGLDYDDEYQYKTYGCSVRLVYDKD